MRAAAFAFALVAAACGRAAPTEPPSGPAAPRPAAASSLEPWVRGAEPPAGKPGAPTLGSAVPAALAELLDHVPRTPGSAAPGPSRLGAPTNVPEAEPGRPAASAEPSARAAAGPSAKPPVPDMSTPSVERECRAQLYWPLVERCRDPGGAILPPEVVTLRFLIDADGAVVSSSIQATASDPRWEAAAECMRRELSALPFRAPASVRGAITRVEATVPSVD